MAFCEFSHTAGLAELIFGTAQFPYIGDAGLPAILINVKLGKGIRRILVDDRVALAASVVPRALDWLGMIGCDVFVDYGGVSIWHIYSGGKPACETY